MSCDVAHERLSAALDGALDADGRADLDAHVAACPACAAHQERLLRLRRAVRYEVVSAVPDVAPAVLAKLSARGRRRVARAPRARARRREWATLAAALLVGVVAGTAFIGLDMQRSARVRADVPRRVVAAQAQVTALHARMTVVERGWHPDVPLRRYQGSLVYRAPESLSVTLDDRTAYPDRRWVANDVVAVTDGDRWWARGPVRCPIETLPDCADPAPRLQVVTGREPFRAATPAPLDLVVPVRSFALAAVPEWLGSSRVAGRYAVGMVTTAAQIAPLLDGLSQAGTLREVHPSDRVEVWLDEQALVPLKLTVRATEGPERALWASRHGYDDRAGDAVLAVRLDGVEVNGIVPDGAFPPPPGQAEARDAGFVDRPRQRIDVPEPGWLPDGMTAHRSGVARGSAAAPEVAVASWSDGLAWVKVRATRDWGGQRLLGQLGDTVRRVELASGTAYVGDGGRTVAVHGRAVDVVIEGSVPEDTLLRIAGSLGVRGEPVPGSWPEAGTASIAEVSERTAALVPPELAGFAPPAARVVDGTVVIAVAGPGSRGFVLTQTPDDTLAPPLHPDVRGVEVRGVAGRYTPGIGELEWVEGGYAVSLRSDTLAADELVAVAERLEPRARDRPDRPAPWTPDPTEAPG